MKPVRPYPALLLQEESEPILVVADVHIGWEAALAEKGIHVPSQTPKIQTKILNLIKLYKPTTLIFLGDVKHTIAKVKAEEWRAIPDFFNQLTRKVPDIRVIPGNHDGNLAPLLPVDVEVTATSGITVGEVGLFHGHAWPAPELLRCPTLITGHVHPVVAFRDPLGFRITRQVWVKAKLDRKQFAKALLKYLGIKADEQPVASLEEHFNLKLRAENFFIMPSFNEFLGGQPVNKRDVRKESSSKGFIGPILRSKSVYTEDAELFLLDGTFIGKIKQLRDLA